MTLIAAHTANVYDGSYKKPLHEMKDFERFTNTHVTWYTFMFGDKRYIFITGTNDFRDVIADLRVIPSQLNGERKGVKVHSGFEGAWGSIRDDVMQVCRTTDNHITIAGHSMGGAIATIGAVELSDHFNVTCVTFGCPRVGNKAFTELFNKVVFESLRLVLRKDAVTKWPKLMWFYRHVDTLYQSKGIRWFDYLPFFRANAHPMSNYKDGIRDDMWEFN